MEKYYPFNLNKRLLLCSKFVSDNAKIADIGTDHAYLPIFLACMGKINHAIAADVKKLPLDNGKKNIIKYGVCDIVETRLSDGLKNISSDEADEIIIAGMGGELIASIIDNAKWLKDKNKKLIMQPMTRAHILREYLFENGFEIKNEECVFSEKRVYSVIEAKYTGECKKITEKQKYIGLIDTNKSPENAAYVQKILNTLEKKARGISLSNNNNVNNQNEDDLLDLIAQIKNEL